MGEGLLRSFAGDFLEVESAGSHPAGFVHPLAVEVMAEIGIDISTHKSKSLDLFLDRKMTAVITVCGNVNQRCPVFPGQIERLHHSFEDPAKAEGSAEQVREVFRRVRDEIQEYVEQHASRWREDWQPCGLTKNLVTPRGSSE